MKCENCDHSEGVHMPAGKCLHWSGAYCQCPRFVPEAMPIGDSRVTPITNVGAKHDAGKDQWDLLLVMLGAETHDVVRGLMHGAEKYKEDPEDPNYRKVRNPRRRFGNALVRHAFRWLRGEKIDSDSGIPHLALVVVNALFLMWHDNNG
jgi:hypothetical protein